MVATLSAEPQRGGVALATELYSPSLDTYQRVLILDTLSCAALDLAGKGPSRARLEGKRGSSSGVRRPPPAALGKADAGKAGRVTWRASRSLRSSGGGGQARGHTNRCSEGGIWNLMQTLLCSIWDRNTFCLLAAHHLTDRVAILSIPPGAARTGSPRSRCSGRRCCSGAWTRSTTASICSGETLSCWAGCSPPWVRSSAMHVYRRGGGGSQRGPMRPLRGVAEGRRPCRSEDLG